MLGGGLEPPRSCDHQPLKLVCLPFHHPSKENWKASGKIPARGLRRKRRKRVNYETREMREREEDRGCVFASFAYFVVTLF